MTISLIACSRSKRLGAAVARELYQGERFKRAYAYSLLHGYEPYILSAKHGLLSSEQEIEPYDESLADITQSARHAWAENIVSLLQKRGLMNTSIVVLAEDLYALPLKSILPNASYPLLGLSEVEQRMFLST